VTKSLSEKNGVQNEGDMRKRNEIESTVEEDKIGEAIFVELRYYV
jgi:hypothetical protein